MSTLNLRWNGQCNICVKRLVDFLCSGKAHLFCSLCLLGIIPMCQGHIGILPRDFELRLPYQQNYPPVSSYCSVDNHILPVMYQFFTVSTVNLSPKYCNSSALNKFTTLVTQFGLSVLTVDLKMSKRQQIVLQGQKICPDPLILAINRQIKLLS